MDEPDSTSDEQASLVPFERKWVLSLFYSSLLLWVLILVYWALGWRRFEDQLFPLLTGIGLASLIVIQLVKIHFGSLFPSTAGSGALQDEVLGGVQSTPDIPKIEQEKVEIIMIFWILLFPPLVYYLGFFITIPLYTLSFLWYFLRDLRKSAIYTAILSVSIYVVFVVLLRVRIWEGVLF